MATLQGRLDTLTDHYRRLAAGYDDVGRSTELLRRLVEQDGREIARLRKRLREVMQA